MYVHICKNMHIILILLKTINILNKFKFLQDRYFILFTVVNIEIANKNKQKKRKNEIKKNRKKEIKIFLFYIYYYLFNILFIYIKLIK